MAKIIKEIEIEGEKVTALFDTGVVYTYVKREIVPDALKLVIPEQYREIDTYWCLNHEKNGR